MAAGSSTINPETTCFEWQDKYFDYRLGDLLSHNRKTAGIIRGISVETQGNKELFQLQIQGIGRPNIESISLKRKNAKEYVGTPGTYFIAKKNIHVASTVIPTGTLIVMHKKERDKVIISDLHSHQIWPEDSTFEQQFASRLQSIDKQKAALLFRIEDPQKRIASIFRAVMKDDEIFFLDWDGQMKTEKFVVKAVHDGYVYLKCRNRMHSLSHTTTLDKVYLPNVAQWLMSTKHQWVDEAYQYNELVYVSCNHYDGFGLLEAVLKFPWKNTSSLVIRCLRTPSWLSEVEHWILEGLFQVESIGDVNAHLIVENSDVLQCNFCLCKEELTSPFKGGDLLFYDKHGRHFLKIVTLQQKPERTRMTAEMYEGSFLTIHQSHVMLLMNSAPHERLKICQENRINCLHQMIKQSSAEMVIFIKENLPLCGALVSLEDGLVVLKDEHGQEHVTTIDKVFLPNIEHWIIRERREYEEGDILYFSDHRVYKGFGILKAMISLPWKCEDSLVIHYLQSPSRSHRRSTIDSWILQQLLQEKKINKTEDCVILDDEFVYRCLNAYLLMDGDKKGHIVCELPGNDFRFLENGARARPRNDKEKIDKKCIPFLMAIKDEIKRVKVVHNNQLDITMHISENQRLMKEDGTAVTFQSFHNGYIQLKDASELVTVDSLFDEVSTPKWVENYEENWDDKWKVDSKVKLTSGSCEHVGRLKAIVKVPWGNDEYGVVVPDPIEGMSQAAPPPDDLRPFHRYFSKKFHSQRLRFYNLKDIEVDDIEDDLSLETTVKQCIQSSIDDVSNVSMASDSEALSTCHSSIFFNEGLPNRKNQEALCEPSRSEKESTSRDLYKFNIGIKTKDEGNVHESRHHGDAFHEDDHDSTREDFQRESERDEGAIKTDTESRSTDESASLIKKLLKSSDVRQRIEKSGQFKPFSLSAGKEVLVWHNVSEDLIKDEIREIREDGILMKSEKLVPIDRIFDMDYLSASNDQRNWTKNELDEKSYLDYVKDELIFFASSYQEDKKCAGFLKWMACVPWRQNELMLGVECCHQYEINDTDFNESQFILLQNGMERNDKSIIIPESQFRLSGTITVADKVKLLSECEMKMSVLTESIFDTEKQYKRGSLWIRKDAKFHNIDNEGQVDDSYSEKFLDVRSELACQLAHLKLDQRLRIRMSKQLEKTKLREDEIVLVYQEDSNQFIRCKIKKVKDGVIVVAKEETDSSDMKETSKDDDRDFDVTLENVFDDGYDKKTDFKSKWSENLIKDVQEYEQKEVIFYKFGVGSLEWLGKLPWEENHLYFGIDKFKDKMSCAKKNPGLENETFHPYFTFEMDTSSPHIIISKNDVMTGPDLKLHILIGKYENFASGSIWMKESSKYYCVEGSGEISSENAQFETVEHQLAKMLVHLEMEKRLRVLLSKQVELSSVQPGAQVKVNRDGRLISCKIREILPSGHIITKESENDADDDKDESFSSSENGDECLIHLIYSNDYETRKGLEWTDDLLKEDKLEHKRNEILFFWEDHAAVGILKYALRTPWDDKLKFILQRVIKKEDQNVDGKELVNFTQVPYEDFEQNTVTITEDQILSDSKMVILTREAKNKSGRSYERGSLWIKTKNRVPESIDTSLVARELQGPLSTHYPPPTDEDHYLLLAVDERDHLKASETEHKDVPLHLVPYMQAVVEDCRLRVITSCQLNSSLSPNMDVLLWLPDHPDDPKYLKPGKICGINLGKITIKIAEKRMDQHTSSSREQLDALLPSHTFDVGADRVFDPSFLGRIPSMGNKADGTTVVFKAYEEKYRKYIHDDFDNILHDIRMFRGRKFRLGREKWRESVPWETENLCGVECLPDFNDPFVTQSEEIVYVHFREVMRVAKGKGRLVHAESVSESFKPFLMSGQGSDGDYRCELWAEFEDAISGDDMFECLDPESHLDVQSEKEPVPHKFLPYIIRMKPNILRKQFLLSKQLDRNSLESGRSILIDNDGEFLEKATIEGLEDGLVFIDQSTGLTIDKIFDAEYNDSDVEWSKNLLSSEKDAEFKEDDIVSIIQDGQCYIGFLKWIGKVPWLKSRLMGIEFIKFAPENNGINGTMVNFKKVMSTRKDLTMIVEEQEVFKIEKVVILTAKYQDFDIGSLWSRKGKEKLYQIGNPGEIKCEDLSADQWTEKPVQILNYILQIDEKARKKVLLSGQIEGLELVAGKEVLVVKDPEKTVGSPFNLLKAVKIINCSDGVIEVDEFGKVDIGRIFSRKYPELSHPWAESILGRPGFLQVTHNQEVHCESHNGKYIIGKVRWFGQLPWETDLFVGIEKTTEEEEEEEFDGRFMHFVQVMHSCKAKTVIVPLNSIKDEYVSDPIKSPFIQIDNPDFPEDCKVAFIDNNIWFLGVVRWTGAYRSTINTPLAAVVTTKKHSQGTNGRFNGITLIKKCPPSKAVLMGTSNLYKIPELKIGDRVKLLPPVEGPKCSAVVKWIDEPAGRTARVSVGIQLSKRYSSAVDVSEKFQCPSGYGMIVYSYQLALDQKDDTRITEPVNPIASKNYEQLLGNNKGIQGFRNSCYLDTIIFSMFAFTSAFEKRIKISQETDADDGRKILLNDIVYPLRKNLFVPSRNVLSLRQILAGTSGKREYLSETRDIPECLELLFEKVLQIRPWIRTISNNTNMTSFHTEIFHIEKPNIISTSQLCLEFSSMFMDFRFVEKPNLLILQLQRQQGHSAGKFIPMLYLDLSMCMANYVPSQCSVCNKDEVPTHTSYELFNEDGLKSTYICSVCAETAGDSFPIKQRTQSEQQKTDSGNKMRLTAVICIERSHYNCFVRCGEDDKWVFFDSMADQNASGENIPKVKSVNLSEWIRDALKGVKTSKKFEPTSYEDKFISQRPFVHPYALIYES